MMQEIHNHLAGQFDYMISYEAPADISETRGSYDENKKPCGEKKTVILGCNLLARRSHQSSADQFTLIATPLSSFDDGSNQAKVLHTKATIDLQRSFAPRESISSTGTNPAMSESRFEDSVGDMDSLEEAWEVLAAATSPRHVAFSAERTSPSTGRKDAQDGSTAQRATASGQFATVRAKPSDKPKKTLRRSTSLSLRDRALEMTRNKPNTSPTSQSVRGTVRSTKPTTVANFELPGEAVSRRLKEQREARDARRAETQKTPAVPPKFKSVRSPLRPNIERPTFELPGEAVGRRKREEREARVKAQEVEERKRREFKARPLRQSPSTRTLPRSVGRGPPSI